MRINAAGVLLAALVGLVALSAEAADRPNVVWLLSEDNSTHYLKLYHGHGAETPRIAGMAEQGVLFNHAFSNSPVCSVARTTVMSGCYGPRIGTQYHRKIRMAEFPPGQSLFPALLREAGYYTTNNVKTDYNVKTGKEVWDESSRKATWRGRPTPQTPFFHMQSNAASHESSLHFSPQDMRQDLAVLENADIEVAPYHPDTPLVRYTNARYHERIRRIDQWVGSIVDQLQEDGLLEDTFIFYFGDHGGVLPRSKGYLYETGLHVPLVVRVPANWKHLVPFARGARAEGFVSFVDFGPTVLQLAGVPVPDSMDGKPFLGTGISADNVESRDEAFGYADRFDEKYELVRSLRKGRFKYIRNFEGFYPDALQNNYRYRQLAFSEWRELYRAGKLNAVQRAFFEPKPAESLYDLSQDPYETRNLAADPRYADQLVRLRTRLAERMKALPDLSLYPESHLVDSAMSDPIEFGRTHRKEIGELIDVANLGVLSFAESEPRLRQELASADRWHRYWAAICCSVYGVAAGSLADAVEPLLQDDEPLVRLRAAEFLGSIGKQDPVPVIRQVLKESESPVFNLIALNSVVFLQDGPHRYDFGIRAADVPAKNDEVKRRLEYLNP